MHRSISELKDLLNIVTRYQADGLRTKAGDETIALGSIKKVLRDISTGKIRNKEEAEREYLKTVFNDKNLLKETTKRYTGKKRVMRYF